MNVKFGVESLQGILFLSNFAYGKKIELINKLSNSLPFLFEKDPVLLPIPDDAPPDIPRIMLSNESEEYKCNISANRIDFFYEEEKEPKIFKEIFEQFYSNYKKLFTSLKSDFNPQISRISLVSKLISFLKESSNNLIKNTFLKEEIFMNPHNLDLIILYKDKVDTLIINRLIKIKSLRKIEDPENDKALRLEIDISTLLEITGDYNKEEIDKIYKLIINKVDYSINQFFLKDSLK